MTTSDSKIKTLILSLLAIPLVLLIRILSPLVTVRILKLGIFKIGLVLPVFDTFVCRRKAGLNGSRTIDFCCFGEKEICNGQVKKMIERSIPIHPFAFWVDKVNRCIPGWEKHVIPYTIRIHCDSTVQALPSLSFTEDELEFGREQLKKLGVVPGSPFICFHAREATYLNTHLSHMNWDYHDYRNADIDNYTSAIEALVSKGYFAVRMGRHVEKEFKAVDSKIIDYAVSGGSDFLDMYLSAHCRFFIAGSDGLAEVPTVFRRPVVWIDFVPFAPVHLVTKGQLFIPKKFRLSKEERFLTLDEMLNTEVAQYGRTEEFQEAGIEMVNNTPEEILDVSMEMEDRLNETWVETQEDKELQQRFREIVEGNNRRKFSGLIGAQYLRQNKELLGESLREQTV